MSRWPLTEGRTCSRPNRVSGISDAASVRRALSRLAELRYIYKYRDEWKFNSTFFRSWLKRYA